MKPFVEHKIKKLHIQETIIFAGKNIPGVDQKTLEKLLELVNADGTHGIISQEKLLTKMRLILKYIPGVCVQSLVILADLLELPISNPMAILRIPEADTFAPDMTVAHLIQTAIFDEVSS